MAVLAAFAEYAIGIEAIAGEAVHGQPTVVVTAPTTNQLVTSALTVTWTYTANPITLLAQGFYRVKLYSADRSLTFYDSGLVAGAGTSAVIPLTYFSDTLTYQVSLVVRPAAPATSVDDTYEQFVTVIADFADVNAYPDVPGVGTIYEIGINGLGYMLADMTDAGVSASMATRRYGRKTVALDSQRFATTSTPFSEGVDRYVFKNFSDFSGGAGQRYLDHDDSSPTAYWDSENVNPFVPGQLTMNPAVQTNGATTGTVPTVNMNGTVFAGEWYVGPWSTDKTIGKNAATSAVSTFTIAAATTILDMASSGEHWYAAAGAAGIFRNTSGADPGAAWSAKAARIIEWVSDRLAIAYPTSGSTPNIFSTLTAAGLEEVPGGRIVLPVGWSITSITSGGGKVWFAASTNDRGAVFVWTIGSPNVPTVAFEFPLGQRPMSVFAYQGNVFVRVSEWTTFATSKSKAYIFRCVPDAQGALTPTLVATLGDSTSTVDQSVGSFTARGNIVYFTWRNMTTLGSTWGVGAIDLVGGGWTKWTYLATASVTAAGDLFTFGQSLCWPHATTSAILGVDSVAANDGIVAAGYLKTSLIDGNSNLLKIYDSLATIGTIDTAAKTITVDYSTDLASYTNIATATLTGPNGSVDTAWGKRARAVSFKIGLSGFVSKTASFLATFTVKLHQLGLADQIVTLPVLCADDFSDLNGKRLDADSGPGRGSSRARFLENLAQTRVKFQDKDWSDSRTAVVCEVISADTTEVSVRSAKRGKINEMLVVVLTLRRALR